MVLEEIGKLVIDEDGFLEICREVKLDCALIVCAIERPEWRARGQPSIRRPKLVAWIGEVREARTNIFTASVG